MRRQKNKNPYKKRFIGYLFVLVLLTPFILVVHYKEERKIKSIMYKRNKPKPKPWKEEDKEYFKIKPLYYGR